LPPGASDLADFNVTTVNTPQIVNLNANQAAASVLFDSFGSVTVHSGVGTSSITVGPTGVARCHASSVGVTITAPVAGASSIRLINGATLTGNTTIDVTQSSGTLKLTSPTSPATVAGAFFLRFFFVVFAASRLAMAGGPMLSTEIAV
jgi:hypothetical protein